MPYIGEVKVSRRKVPEGYRVERHTTGFAYARNGNTHNPTPRYTWKAFYKGTFIGFAAYESGALDIVSIHAEDNSHV